MTIDQPTKPESWDEVLAKHSTDVQAAARECLRIILEELPGAVVTFDRADGLLAIGTGGGMRGWHFALIPHRGWLNLQLADGARLPNGDGLIEGTGKSVRHVKLRSAESANDPRLRAIVAAQVAARAVD